MNNGDEHMPHGEPVVVIGAGIAGLSAAWRLQQERSALFTVFEKSGHVGGCCRTCRHGECLFDLGGHRFYTKKGHVREVVEQVLGDDLTQLDRRSRIVFNGRFVDYPLSAFNALRALGPFGAAHAAWDYGARCAGNMLRGKEPETTFEDWCLNRFGQYLYNAYFKPYTEKLWGVDCTGLSADFAEQRIKGLSFREAVRDIFSRHNQPASLIRSFTYARRGFGQITDNLAAAVQGPNEIRTGHAVKKLRHEHGRIREVVASGPDGDVARPCSHVVNTAPLDELVHMLSPDPPLEVLSAALRLRYRDMVIIFVELNMPRVSPDHWVYIPSRSISLARFHEPKNWSAAMAPADSTGLVLEFFCQEGDEIWKRDPGELAGESVEHLSALGLVKPEAVAGFRPVRLRKAYPVYYRGYEEPLRVVWNYLSGFANLVNIGRNATFVYTSSDHYIDMGLKAAENLCGHNHDLGIIGREAGYAETM